MTSSKITFWVFGYNLILKSERNSEIKGFLCFKLRRVADEEVKPEKGPKSTMNEI